MRKCAINSFDLYAPFEWHPHTHTPIQTIDRKEQLSHQAEIKATAVFFFQQLENTKLAANSHSEQIMLIYKRWATAKCIWVNNRLDFREWYYIVFESQSPVTHKHMWRAQGIEWIFYAINWLKVVFIEDNIIWQYCLFNFDGSQWNLLNDLSKLMPIESLKSSHA